MRKVNPAINIYKTVTSIPVKNKTNNVGKHGLLAPRNTKSTQSKSLQPVEKVARIINSIKMQREAYKNGDS